MSPADKEMEVNPVVEVVGNSSKNLKLPSTEETNIRNVETLLTLVTVKLRLSR